METLEKFCANCATFPHSLFISVIAARTKLLSSNLCIDFVEQGGRTLGYWCTAGPSNLSLLSNFIVAVHGQRGLARKVAKQLASIAGLFSLNNTLFTFTQLHTFTLWSCSVQHSFVLPITAQLHWSN